jgi:hypothetical protein
MYHVMLLFIFVSAGLFGLGYAMGFRKGSAVMRDRLFRERR